jgi:RNA polymerase sigma factor (sigma-70 family)
MQYQDAHFSKFIDSLAVILAGYGENTTALQASQVNGLVRLEKKFRRALIRHPEGLVTYKCFVDECKNILGARPFFRERDTVFKSSISGILKVKDHVALTRFNINRRFIDWVLKRRDWGSDKDGQKLLKIAEAHKNLRAELVQCNLPLALSQAKQFHRKNLLSHLDGMDFIQIGAIGMMEAVDKFSGPYRRAFRAVAVGRMVGNWIEENSQTSFHFFPKERQALYRIRKLIRQQTRQTASSEIDYSALHERLNEVEVESGSALTSYSDMLHISAASQMASPKKRSSPGKCEVGAYTSTVNQYSDLGIENVPDSEQGRPDMIVEETEARECLGRAIRGLPLRDQKLLAAKGVGRAS